MFRLANAIKKFFGEVKTELIKCSWPSRKELFGQSVVVVIAVIILGVFIAICDVVNIAILDWLIR